MFSRFDKAFAAAAASWLAGGLVMLIEHGFSTDVAPEVGAFFTTIIIAGLTWLVPNRGGRA